MPRQTSMAAPEELASLLACGRWVFGLFSAVYWFLIHQPKAGRQAGRQALSHLIFFWFCIALMGLVSSARTDASIKSKRTRVEEAC